MSPPAVGSAGAVPAEGAHLSFFPLAAPSTEAADAHSDKEAESEEPQEKTKPQEAPKIEEEEQDLKVRSCRGVCVRDLSWFG